MIRQVFRYPTSTLAVSSRLAACIGVAVCSVAYSGAPHDVPGHLTPTMPGAASGQTPGGGTSGKTNPSQAPVSTKPDWRDLTSAQRAALAPLALQWPTLTEGHKRKWLALSQNFSSLTAAEQATMHARMSEWVALSAQQRSQARLNFAGMRNVPADQRLAHWEAYQALSPDEKQKLAASAPTKPMGAAPAIRPVASSKLAVTPATAASATGPTTPMGRSTPRIATAPHQIDRQTLQPKAPPFQIPTPQAEIEHETPPHQ